MVALEAPPLVGKRYILRDLLGQGGMGKVYHAYDLLTGSDIALKQVARTADGISTTAPTQDNDLRLALAQEFRVLASLRHPHIVSVLDYGFDADRQPYFTMELLGGARDIYEATRDLPLEEQVHLLVQTLQALAYLHRRGVLHRDLKPSNVLVIDQRVKVVDFGLALSDNAPDSALGTLPYLPPELLYGQQPDERADLYALGLIAHEVLAGSHPFESENRAQLINNIINKTPDLSGFDPRLASIIGRLLMKQPENRYSRAGDVIIALYTALNLTLPPESPATRESFLKAARLIGREAELGQLTQALVRTLGGRGEAWLLGGESGVGKTRLLDELRTLALVRGALVVRGETVSEAATPYSPWRELLRWLALTTSPLDRREASVLKAILPDIETLIGSPEPVPLAPPLDPESAQTRLFAVIEAMLNRLDRPLVILLEDLHYAGSESLALLNWIARVAPRLSVLVIGSFRDDERPSLPKELPNARLMRLQRLSFDQIRALSEAMLGEVGRDARLVELLERETEGNAFFIVEVVRALAEEAGDFARITEINLHRRVLTGGVRRLLQQRLARVPQEAHRLLRIAAAIGQQIDRRLLEQIAPGVDVQAWLNQCVDSVLMVQDDRWLFSHFKLRELILSEIEFEERRQIHRTIAEAIAATRDPAQEALALTYHWAMVGDPAQEGYYAALAGERAYENGSWSEAVTLLGRAYTLRNALGLTALQSARLLRLQADAWYRQGSLPEARRCLNEAAAILQWPMPTKRSTQMRTLVRQLGRQVRHRIIITPRRQTATREWMLETHRISLLEAEIAFLSNETIPMLIHGVGALNQAESAGISPELAKASANMCYAIGNIGLHLPARIYKRQARRVAQQVGDPAVEDFALRRTSLYDIGLGRWAEAETALEQALQLAESIGDLQSREESLDFLASLRYYRGEYDRSHSLFRAVYQSAVRTNSLLHQSWGLLGQGQNALRLGSLDDAARLLQNAINLLEDGGVHDIVTLIQGCGLLAVTEHYRGRAEAAAILAKTAFDRVETSDATGFALLEGYAGAAEVYLAALEGERENAALLARAAASVRHLRALGKTTPIAQPRAQLYSGWLALLKGEPTAQRKIRAALRQAARLQMPFEQAFAHFHLGRSLPIGNTLRVQHLGQACALFTRLGAVHHLARARQALDAGIDEDTAGFSRIENPVE